MATRPQAEVQPAASPRSLRAELARGLLGARGGEVGIFGDKLGELRIDALREAEKRLLPAEIPGPTGVVLLL